MAMFKCSNVFRAVLTVLANPGSTVTVVGFQTYVGIANADGVVVFVIKDRGTHIVTTSYSTVIRISVEITERRAYSVDAYMDPVFGNGSLGDATISSNTTWYAGTEDTGVKEVQYKNLTINSGVSVSMGNRNSGIIIRCQGNCTINGSIYNLYAPKSHSVSLSAYYPSWMVSNGTGGRGGDGGISGHCSGTLGSGQSGRYYGGGYGGGGAGGGSLVERDGSMHYCNGGNGGNASGIVVGTTLFVGGASKTAQNPNWYLTGDNGAYGGGGSGGAYIFTSYAENVFYSGAGGNSGGGAGGNGTGPGWLGCAGGGGGAGNYGGGNVIIYVYGTLTVNGGIYCHGSNGGAGGGVCAPEPQSHTPGGGGGGGAGGGGRIYLMSRGAMHRGGTFNVGGGSGGAGGPGVHRDGWYSGGHNGNNGGNGNRYYITYSNFNHGAGTPTQF